MWLVQVPVAEREGKLKEAGLDPNLLKNLTLVYRDPTVYLALQFTTTPPPLGMSLI
jgi:hypothetical protein